MGRLPFASRLSKIFLSYRREDAAAYAGRIYDRLVAHFGKERIFFDVDHILAGDDFVRVLEEAVAESEILLLLIGRHWLTVADSDGIRRLDNPEDFVRLEAAAALERKIRLIPILVGGANMPRSLDLPEPIRAITRRHAFEISDLRFHADVDQLIGDSSFCTVAPPCLAKRGFCSHIWIQNSRICSDWASRASISSCGIFWRGADSDSGIGVFAAF